MKLWSKGLGKLVLPFDMDKAESVEEAEECIIIKGRIIEKKVNWPYLIRLYPDDMVRFTHLIVYDNVVLSYLKRRMGLRLLFFLIAKFFFALLMTPLVIGEKMSEWIRGMAQGISRRKPVESPDLPKTGEAEPVSVYHLPKTMQGE